MGERVLINESWYKMCAEMVATDLKEAQRHAFLKANGFELPVSMES